MYEIGDSVTLKGFDSQITGKIVSYHYDEGDVWTIKTEYQDRVDQFIYLDCCENENGILALL